MWTQMHLLDQRDTEVAHNIWLYQDIKGQFGCHVWESTREIKVVALVIDLSLI